ncbi:PAS domain S-box protein [Indioceanicola profundi]|uniref:PAS domain S-box protein n=1 Tax=Indioceanicola profundi TaxID=2220096 RepID=UPI0013C44F79|nr:PAS domain S-box protein [Indioceanicola profundi]
MSRNGALHPAHDRIARLVLDSATDVAIITTDLRGIITSWNVGAAAIMGWQEAEAAGNHIEIIFTPEDRAQAACASEMETVRSQGRAEDERWHMRRDGTRFYGSGQMMRLEDETSGEQIGFLKILRDRTAEQRHRATARMSESRQAFLLELTDLLRGQEDTPEILRKVSAMLGAHFQVDRVGYGHVDEAADLIEYDICWTDGTVPPLLGTFAASAFGYRVIDRLRAGQTVVMDDVRSHPLTDDQPALRTSAEVDTRAVLVVPLVKAGRLRTIVYLNQRPPRTWTPDEVLLMEEVAERTRELIERGRAEQALRASEARWRGLFERMHEGFFVGEAIRDDQGRMRDFRFLEANPAFEMLTGVPIQQAVGRPVREVIPGIQDQLIEDYARVVDTGCPAQFEVHVPALQDRWYEARARQTGPDQFAVLFLEITARKAAEAALEQSQELLKRSETRFRQLTELAPAIIWFGNPDGSLSYLNPYWYEYTGQTPETALPMGWADVIHPDDADRLAAIWESSRARGVLYELEARLRRLDGAYRWFVIRAQPLRDETGRVTGWLGNNSDIDDRKAAEDALTRLNETLEQRVAEALAERRIWAEIFETSDALIGVVDREFRFLALNRAYADEFERIYGVRPYPGADLRALLAEQPRHRAAVQAIWARALHGETFTVVEEFGEEARARPCYELRFNTLRDSRGAIVGAFQYAVDVTERLRDQARLMQAETALRQSQKMEAVGQLTGGIAHDFNNLLQVVSGNLELLARDVAGNARAEMRVRNALAGVARGSKLASQLLAFGRRQALEPKVVNIGRFVKDMDDMLRRALGAAVEIETIIEGGLWNTLIDPGQVENAILNLAINARDAMDGHGRLTIEASNAVLDAEYARLQKDVKAGQYVMLAVTDTGTGIPPDVLERVFEPFFTTKAEGKGSGLGLSMVYGFVKQSGGHISIYSEVGEGTTVKLYLPRVLEAEDVLVETAAVPIRGGAETILVVEDDEDVRETAVALLTELGYRVLRAKDAASALGVIESGLPIDLLFTDVVMPGPLRSPDLARKARQRLPNIAVLFTSGYTENAIVHGGRLDPGVELLAKPYSREGLARKVRHVLANQEQRNQAGAKALTAPRPNPTKVISPRPLKVLLVEDDDLIRASTCELLADLGHEVADAPSAETAIPLLQAGRFDLLVVDMGLPGMSGTDLARKVRETDPGIAVIFATGDSTAPAIGGAPAILLRKPYNGADLAAALGELPDRKAG